MVDGPMPATSDRATSNRNWQAESLRLTAFVTPSAQVKGEDWWTRIAGTQPETRTAKPALGQMVDAGIFEGNSLTLSIQPGRIDWFLSPDQSKVEDSAVEIRSIGSFREVVGTFLSAMLKWLELCPPIIRLAYGAILLEPVENKEVGYRRLSEYLPSVRVDAEASADFSYQINRPRKSQVKIDGLQINRLSKWSVTSLHSVTLAVGPKLIHQYRSAAQTMACRLELDINTPAEIQDELPHDKLGDIFRELTNMGSEIANRGDIP